MAGVRSGGHGGAHDDADADGLNWELSPRQSEGYGRAIDAAVTRDLAVAATARRSDAPGAGPSARHPAHAGPAHAGGRRPARRVRAVPEPVTLQQ
jgi:hypothetical protein